MSKLLIIDNLSISVREKGSDKPIVSGVSLEIPHNSIVGLVGGSGSGKTTTGLSILRLLSSGLRIASGRINFFESNLLTKTEEEMQKIRGKEIAMIFQEPLHAFNPVFTIGYQIEEVLTVHSNLSEDERRKRIIELISMVGLPEPLRVAGQYPHQLSGGMRQRAMIAQAIAANPKLIIADEPTSNLDVTLQATIMELFTKLKQELDLSILLITHDLGMVKHVADSVAVMHKGTVVESGDAKKVTEDPSHAYTQKLMGALNL